MFPKWQFSAILWKDRGLIQRVGHGKLGWNLQEVRGAVRACLKGTLDLLECKCIDVDVNAVVMGPHDCRSWDVKLQLLPSPPCRRRHHHHQHDCRSWALKHPSSYAHACPNLACEKRVGLQVCELKERGVALTKREGKARTADNGGAEAEKEVARY
ncbi:hypothetical protein NC651_031706 [Populus alba x Populus x berolinensis]|nr:hypothetical protein NC651_031706 [Populus alba x Populus x berolinensis]